jgi:N-dimethylarginine dimethylaminohydrolase
MMYMMPIDDHTVAVGDIRAGVQLLGSTPLALDDIDVEATRFDHAADLLAAQGFKVVRVPALVLAGAGSYVTYTNALFDRRGTQKIVYMPTYALPALDDAGKRFWEAQGFEVHPIDVSPIYRLNGSLGCLVNVLARG